MSIINPTCPTDCTGLAPEVEFTDCAPELSQGEIQWIYVADLDQTPFTDVEDPAEWAAKLADTGANKIRTLHVMGSLAVPDATETEITHGDKVWSTQTFTLEYDIVDISDKNYEFMRTMECNYKTRIWYATGTHLYGGNDGIEVNNRLSNVIEKGIKSLGKLSGKATWISKFSPERCANPLV